MDILNVDAMTDYDEERGGRGLLVQMTGFAVSDESGVNIKFHVPTIGGHRQSRLAAWRVPLRAPSDRVPRVVVGRVYRVQPIQYRDNSLAGLMTGLAFAV